MAIAYSQRDVEWSDDRLGSSQDLTLGSAGCLVTAVASLLSDLTDRMIAPGELNWWLRDHGGFSNGVLFNFNSVAPLGARATEVIRCQAQPAPIQQLIDVLAEGAGVVVQVDARPGGALDQHWVRILALDARDGEIMDPWQLPGKELCKLSTYFAQDWTPARAIFMAVVYRAGAASRDALMLDEHQPQVCIRIEEPAGSRPRSARRNRRRRTAASPGKGTG